MIRAEFHGKILLAGVLAAALAACAGPREFTPPPVGLEDQRFVNAPETAAEAVLTERWWRRFEDPLLDRLVEETVLGNLDLQRAAARVREARALLLQSRAERRPEVTVNASAERSRAPVAFGDPISDRYSLSLGFAYEIDLWGRIANLTEAAVRDWLAAEEEHRRAYQSLVAEVVRTYVEVRMAEEQEALAQETAENDRRRLDVVEGRYRSGLIPALDVYQARQTVAQAETRVYTFRLRAEQARHRLNILRGRYPAAAAEEQIRPGPLEVPELVPVGLPADLLARRPDLRAAEHRLAASNARIGVAEANLYPRLALTGSAGRVSDAVRELTAGSNTVWSLLANLTHSLYNAGANRAAVEQAQSRYRSVYLEFAAALLEALGQVEDVLVAEEQQRERLRALASSTELAQRTLDLSMERYLRGLDDLTPTLNARSALFLSRLDQLETRRALLLNRVNLYLALGGEWGHEDRLTTYDAETGGSMK